MKKGFSVIPGTIKADLRRNKRSCDQQLLYHIIVLEAKPYDFKGQ